MKKMLRTIRVLYRKWFKDRGLKSSYSIPACKDCHWCHVDSCIRPTGGTTEVINAKQGTVTYLPKICGNKCQFEREHDYCYIWDKMCCGRQANYFMAKKG